MLSVRAVKKEVCGKRISALKPAAYVLAAVLTASSFFAASIFMCRTPASPVLLKKEMSGAVDDSLGAIFGRYGADPAQSSDIINKLRGAGAPLKKLRPDKDSYNIVLSSSGRILSFRLDREFESYGIRFSRTGEITVDTVHTDIRKNTKSASGRISDSLWQSMERNGVPAPVILSYTDIFSSRVDFLTEVLTDDSWSVRWEENVTSEGKLVSVSIIAAAYLGGTSRENAALYEGHYYDESGNSLTDLFLKAPLKYSRISSFFSSRRLHPIYKIFRPHYGIDYAAPKGTPVSAIADGTVIFKGYEGENGNILVLKHSFGYTSSYGHLSGFADIKKGDSVVQGDVIGYVGATGAATGPHLDFRIKLHDKPLDFLKLKPQGGAVVSGRALDEVRTSIYSLPTSINSFSED